MPNTIFDKALPTVIGFFVNATFVDGSDHKKFFRAFCFFRVIGMFVR